MGIRLNALPNLFKTKKRKGAVSILQGLALLRPMRSQFGPFSF